MKKLIFVLLAVVAISAQAQYSTLPTSYPTAVFVGDTLQLSILYTRHQIDSISALRLKNADSSAMRTWSSTIYLKNADSTAQRTRSNAIYLKNADSTTLRNQFLKNADSTTERTWSNTLYPIITAADSYQKIDSLLSLVKNSGAVAIGAGDSTRVWVYGLTVSTGAASVAYAKAGLCAPDTIPHYDINTVNWLTLFGKYGWTVGYVIGKR